MNNVTLQLITQALTEDAAYNDITASATIAADAVGQAKIVAKNSGVLSGISDTDHTFKLFCEKISRQWHKTDGDHVAAGDLIAELDGPMRELLAVERTVLNFLQHLSGIATATHAFVAVVEGTGCKIADTRKTTPGLRMLEKQAVLHGGGINHRMDLESGMLIKENHIAACGSITAAIVACRNSGANTWIEVECETLAEVEEAVVAHPDIILLDNMAPEMVRTARAMVPATIVLEASGNITLANARAYAETGVDHIAIGAITHSAPALDLSMRVCNAGAA